MRPHTERVAIAMGLFLLAAGSTAVRANAAEISVSERPGPVGSLIDQTWTWGYVIQGPLPGKVPFISESGSPPLDGVSSCSLETGAR